MNIYCFNSISKHGTELFTDTYAFTDTLANADAVLVRSASMHDLELPEQLLAIARAGAGVNNIPLDKCAESGVVVFNTPGANANSVKELVLAGLLLSSRDIIGGIKWCEQHKDDPQISKSIEKQKHLFAGNELKGKKLGVIGLGAIGAEVANAGAALGMDVYGYDPFISVNSAWMLSRDVKHISSLDTIYKNCDYITLHIPLLDSTRGMIHQEAVASMKDGVILLNFARDLLVNDEALADALECGKVHRYVTDFPNTNSVHMKNVITIPHLGASTEEAEDNCAIMAVKELMEYLETGNIRRSVNFPDCELELCPGTHRISALHRNIPNMLGQITSVLAEQNINISNLTNKSRNQYACTLLDLERAPEAQTIQKLNAICGMLRVRVINHSF